MAQLILKTDDGQEVEVKEVQSVGRDDKMIVLFIDAHMRPADIQDITDRMTVMFSRKVIVLDALFKDKILSV